MALIGSSVGYNTPSWLQAGARRQSCSSYLTPNAAASANDTQNSFTLNRTLLNGTPVKVFMPKKFGYLSQAIQVGDGMSSNIG